VRNLATTEAIEAKRSWDELFNVIKVKMSPGIRSSGVQKGKSHVLEAEHKIGKGLMAQDE
jgi:hypothetical protein